MCAYLWGPGVNFRSHSSVTIYLVFFETGSLIGLELSKYSRLAGQCALGASCFHLPQTENIDKVAFLHGFYFCFFVWPCLVFIRHMAFFLHGF
jgi:hypothetical protein